MASHNLGTVFKFEFLRTIKKKGFWILAISLPLFIALVSAIAYFSTDSTNKNAEKLASEGFTVQYLDESDTVQPQVAEALKAKKITDRQAGIDAVKNNTIDAFFYIPKDPSIQGIETYGKDDNLFSNGKYPSVAKLLVTQSATAKINDPQLLKLTNAETLSTQDVTYRNGTETKGIYAAILPGLGIIIIYLILSFLGSNFMSATLEEKENRVSEMILTTLNPTTLMLGKYLAVLATGLLQITTMFVPVIVGYFLFKDQLNLPGFDLSSIVFDPARVGVAAALTIGSIALFSGILMFIGAIMPSAKEAGQWLGFVFFAIFIPLYMAGTIVSDPNNLAVQIILWIPITTPLPSLIANAAGTLPIWQGLSIALVLMVAALIVFMMTVRAFRYGSLEYGKVLSLGSIFAKNTK